MAVSQLDIVFLGGFHGSTGVGAYAPVSGIASAIGALFAILASYDPAGNDGSKDPSEGSRTCSTSPGGLPGGGQSYATLLDWLLNDQV